MQEQTNIPAVLSCTLPFWDQLNQLQKDTLIKNASFSHYGKGYPIHCGSSDCVGVMIIVRGSVRTFMLSEDGREITLFRLEDQEVCVLSASCALQAITFEVHIDAIADCDIIRINSSAILKLTEENVYAEAYVYRLTAERFSDVMWTIKQILFMSFDKRLAIFLTKESESTGSDTIHMTHEQIARFMGSAREVVSRMLKYFSQEGLVELTRGGVRLLDRKRLERLAN